MNSFGDFSPPRSYYSCDTLSHTKHPNSPFCKNYSYLPWLNNSENEGSLFFALYQKPDKWDQPIWMPCVAYLHRVHWLGHWNINLSVPIWKNGAVQNHGSYIIMQMQNLEWINNSWSTLTGTSTLEPLGDTSSCWSPLAKPSGHWSNGSDSKIVYCPGSHASFLALTDK